MRELRSSKTNHLSTLIVATLSIEGFHIASSHAVSRHWRTIPICLPTRLEQPSPRYDIDAGDEENPYCHVLTSDELTYHELKQGSGQPYCIWNMFKTKESNVRGGGPLYV